MRSIRNFGIYFLPRKPRKNLIIRTLQTSAGGITTSIMATLEEILDKLVGSPAFKEVEERQEIAANSDEVEEVTELEFKTVICSFSPDKG